MKVKIPQLIGLDLIVSTVCCIVHSAAATMHYALVFYFYLFIGDGWKKLSTTKVHILILVECFSIHGGR